MTRVGSLRAVLGLYQVIYNEGNEREGKQATSLLVSCQNLRNSQDVSSTAQMRLYTRFRSVSTQLAPLLGELEHQDTEHPDELSALLFECQVAYFSTRKSLLMNRLTESWWSSCVPPSPIFELLIFGF